VSGVGGSSREKRAKLSRDGRVVAGFFGVKNERASGERDEIGRKKRK
jgi:hypothetical protein